MRFWETSFISTTITLWPQKIFIAFIISTAVFLINLQGQGYRRSSSFSPTSDSSMPNFSQSGRSFRSFCWPWKLNSDYTLFGFTRQHTSFTSDIPFTMLKRPILWVVRIETLWIVSLLVMTVHSASTTIHQSCQIPTMPAGYQAMVTPKRISLHCFSCLSTLFYSSLSWNNPFSDGLHCQTSKVWGSLFHRAVIYSLQWCE